MTSSFPHAATERWREVLIPISFLDYELRGYTVFPGTPKKHSGRINQRSSPIGNRALIFSSLDSTVSANSGDPRIAKNLSNLRENATLEFPPKRHNGPLAEIF